MFARETNREQSMGKVIQGRFRAKAAEPDEESKIDAGIRDALTKLVSTFSIAGISEKQFDAAVTAEDIVFIRENTDLMVKLEKRIRKIWKHLTDKQLFCAPFDFVVLHQPKIQCLRMDEFLDIAFATSVPEQWEAEFEHFTALVLAYEARMARVKKMCGTSQ